MKVYIARHAQANYNLLELCNDDPAVDVYLTPEGVAQAKLLAESLAEINFDLVITSDFPRTKETARIVNNRNVATIADSRINDVLTGFEGRPAPEFRSARQSAANRWTVRLNGGESFEDEKARVTEFLNDLSKRSEKTVLIVTHQAIARLMHAIVKNTPNEEVDRLEVSNTHCFELEL